jgi:hypothetical protein
MHETTDLVGEITRPGFYRHSTRLQAGEVE